jgi:lysophospholipase L1-like esterase
MKRIAMAVGLILGALAGLIGVELFLLGRREYLPMDPGYGVDQRVGPSIGDPLRLAVLGDSTVAGVGSPTAAESLPVLIAERVAHATDRPVEVRGFGVSGARTATVLRDQLSQVNGSFDAIVLVVGSNDATHATFWPAFRVQVEAMLRRAVQAAPVVVLAGTPRFHANEIIPEPLRTMVDRYSGLLRGEQIDAVDAVPGARFVDLATEASPRFLGVPEATSQDGFHPSPIGYGFWADALAPAVVAGLED